MNHLISLMVLWQMRVDKGIDGLGGSAESRPKTLDCVEMGNTYLILGSEQVGVRVSLLEIADHTVHIPMLGLNSSMNVVIA